MKVIDAPRDFPLQAPNVCFLCEQSPFEDEAVVDTQRNFQSDISRSHLDGRKYVCSRCVAEMANLFNFVSPTEAQALKDAVEAAVAEKEAAEKQVSLQETLKAAVAELSAEKVADPVPDPAPGEKPKTRKTASKKKA
jgi:hypothetical protein